MTKKINLFKTGMFYNAYGDDAIVLFEVMGYKVSLKGISGFPEKSLPKVTNSLENYKIGFRIYNKDVIIEEYNGIDKMYKKIYKNGLKRLDMDRRLNTLYNKIDKMNEKQIKKIIENIEDKINEWF